MPPKSKRSPIPTNVTNSENKERSDRVYEAPMSKRVFSHMEGSVSKPKPKSNMPLPSHNSLNIPLSFYNTISFKETKDSLPTRSKNASVDCSESIDLLAHPELYQNDTFDLAQNLNNLLNTQLMHLTDSSHIDAILPMSTLNHENLPNNEYFGDGGNAVTMKPVFPVSPALSKHDTATTAVLEPVGSATGHIKLSSFSLSPDHMEYLNLFFCQYSRVILPFCPSSNKTDGFGDDVINPARDIILYYALREQYVLAAVLACGALTSHWRTNSSLDEQRYCQYLSTCMSLLSELLEREKQFEIQTKGKMEGMIITTLLLTSYNAASNIVTWRPHLETAGRLLMHSGYLSNGNRSTDRVQREAISFCRSWFFSIEIIAGITSNRGGTITSDDWMIMENWITEDKEILTGLKLIGANSSSDFNLIFGHSNQLAIVFGKLCCTLRRLRSGEEIPLEEITWFLTQLESKQMKDHCIVSKSGYIDKECFNDCASSLYGNVPREALEELDDIASDGEGLYISWWDVCHQTHRMSAVIFTLTTLLKLDKEHFLVKNAIAETVKLLKFLHTNRKITNYSLLMFQICVFLVGRWTSREDDRKLVTKYFTDLHGFGNIAALHSMKKLERMWNNEEADVDEEDIINY